MFLCVRAFLRSYELSFVSTCVRSLIRLCVRAFVHPRSFVRSCVRFSYVRSLVHLIIFFIFCYLVHRKKKNPMDIGKRLCIAPDITILCRVQKHTVPFHMFLPVRLGLYPLFHQIAVKCSANVNFAISNRFYF